MTDRYTTTEAWLAATHQSIGASTSPAICGRSTYQSPYSVWVRVTEPLVIEPPDEMQRWGLLLEPAILDEFMEQSKISANTLPRYTVHRDRERSYMHATLDAITDAGEPIELKTAHFAAAKVWKNEVPLPYVIQVQHQLHVTGANQGYIAVLVDGYQFAWHKVVRHQRFIDRLLRRLDHFWNEYVVKRQPPPTDYSQATSQALARKFPDSHQGEVVELPSELEPLINEYDELTKTESAAKKRKAAIQNLLKERIGDHEYASFGSRDGFKWSGEEGKRRFTRSKSCPEPAHS